MKNSKGVTFTMGKSLESMIISYLDRAPYISFYASTRGWSFLIAWVHRLTGLLLVGFVWFHILTLVNLYSPPRYNDTMKVYGFILFKILEWALAIPVMVHALNGGRLILYESFEIRNNELLIRWLAWLSILYTTLLGVLMLAGNQNVSAVFFWLTMVAAGVTLGYGVTSRLWAIQHSSLWKLQRITGSYLLILIPAHMLFMHLNYAMGHDANIVVLRMQNYFIKIVDLSLVIAVLSHAWYGVASVIGDYIESQPLRRGLAGLVLLVMVYFAWVGIKLALVI